MPQALKLAEPLFNPDPLGDALYQLLQGQLGDLEATKTLLEARLARENEIVAGLEGIADGLTTSVRDQGLVVRKLDASTVQIQAEYLTLYSGDNLPIVLPGVDVTVGLTDAQINQPGDLELWVISNGTQRAGMLSESAVAPVLPEGYSHKRRVGSNLSALPGKLDVLNVNLSALKDLFGQFCSGSLKVET